MNNAKAFIIKEYIKRIQLYLGISPNGVSDVRLKDKISEFQADKGLNVTGVVNFETFEVLKNHYLSMNSSELTPIRGDISFPIIRGSVGANVAELNGMLEKILIEYEYDGIMPRGRLFDDKTEGAVKYVSRIFGIGERNSVDRAMYIRILREIILTT